MTPRCALWLALCSVAFAAGSATAHTRSASYSRWTLDPDGATVQVRITPLELSRLGFAPGADLETGGADLETGGAAARYLAEHLQMRAGGAPCPAADVASAEPAPPGQARFRWRVDCATSGAREIESRLLLAVAPAHLHFARVEPRGAPEHARERVLTEAEPRWRIGSAGEPGVAPEDSRASGLTDYLRLGVLHILGGWDHLAFVFALLLLAHSLPELAALVTSFTVAHSVTLALAVLGWLRPEAGAVEALIAYSIALVAVENTWLLARGSQPAEASAGARALPGLFVLATAALGALAVLGVGRSSAGIWAGMALFSACHFALLARVARPARLRSALAFAFGLVHGFGFAGVLAELDLPAARLAPALFGFNLGVELGQLAIVATLWPGLRALARCSPGLWHPRVVALGSAAVCALGVYWCVTRQFGA